MMLLQAAANEWKVPVAELTVADGVISHAGSERKINYGKVAAAAASGCSAFSYQDIADALKIRKASITITLNPRRIW